MKLSDCKCGTCFYARKPKYNTNHAFDLKCILNPNWYPKYNNETCGQGVWLGIWDDGEIGCWHLCELVNPAPYASIQPVEPWWLDE